MAILKLDFEKEDYQKLLCNEMTVDKFLETILKEQGHEEFDEGTKGQLLSYLFDYHSDKGGSIEIDDFEIVDSSYDRKTKMGMVELHYCINFFFGCADLNNDEDGYEKWQFQIDPKLSVLTLHIPEYENRSTADEF